MKYWEKLSKTIFKLAARKSLKKFQANSLESVLKNSLKLLDTQTIDEIKDFIKSQHTKQGGFADKGGKCDLYYTLFGCYITEALDITELMKLQQNAKAMTFFYDISYHALWGKWNGNIKSQTNKLKI